MLDGIIACLSLFASKELGESMQASKTLMVMTVLGIIFFAAFIGFLFYMAK